MRNLVIWDRDDLLNLSEEEDELEDDVDEESDEDSDLDSNEAEITNEEGHKIRVRMPKSQEVLHSNFGTFLAHHPDNPYNSREVFIANTNFDVTDDHIKLICKVPGVEAFRPLTRYSFTIIIGLIFYYEDVLSEIDDVLGVEPIIMESDEPPIDINEELVAEVTKDIKAEFWFVYIFPNGTPLVEEYDSMDKMAERQAFFLALNHISEGLMLNSGNLIQDDN